MSIPGVGIKTEIAFDSGYRTLAVDRTWTDVSSKVEFDQGIDIGYGRQDEVSNADANTLGITLDNTDGRFTWGRAASPYHPNVRLNRPIRVTATVGGVDYVRYTGYVDEWPLEWTGGGDTYAAAPLNASSRIARLGLETPVLHTVDQVHLLTAPSHYWPLTDPAGSTSATDIGSSPVSMGVTRAPVTFGAGSNSEGPTLGVDDRTAVQLIGVNDTTVEPELTAELSSPIAFGPGVAGGVTLSLFVKNTTPTTSPLTSSLALLYSAADGVNTSTDRFLDLNLFLYEYWDGTGNGPASAWPTNLYEDDGLHHLAITMACDGTNITLTGYLDGQVDTDGIDTRAAVAFAFDRLTIAAPALLTTLVGRVGLWDRALTSTEIADLAASGLTALAGDTTDERLKRYADWARIPAAEVATTASPVTLSGVNAAGAKSLDLMRDVETAEAGVLHDDRENHLTLRTRAARYHRAVDLVLNTNTQDYGADYAPKVDRQGLANVGHGTNSAGTVDVNYVDDDSVDEYGEASFDVETTSEDPDEPLQLIAWRVNGNSEPRPRAPSVTINVLNWISDPTQLAKILALDIGSRVQLSNTPSQAAATSADYFVEGYSETIRESAGDVAWSITLNLSPVVLEDAVWILDDPVYGQLDAGNVLAL